jgi:hypothetical protein
MYDEAVAAGEVEPRWWTRQCETGYDPLRSSEFQARWGWVADGALRSPNGFDAEAWQRKLTRAWYLRPSFAWDTLSFTARNPFFLKHIVRLGKELIPYYRLRNLVPWRTLAPDERLDILSKCPSAPTVSYEPRAGITRSNKLPYRSSKTATVP